MKTKRWLAMVVVLAACKGGDQEKETEKEKQPPPAATDAAVKVAAADAAPKAAGPDAAIDLTGRPRYKLGPEEKISAELLEKLYAAMAECPLVWSGFNSDSCPEKTDIHSAVWGGEQRYLEGDYTRHWELAATVARKMLSHDSPSVRYQAAHDLNYQNKPEDRARIAEMIARETDPKALHAIAEAFMDPSSHPKLAEQALRLAENPAPEVRRAVFLRGLGRGRGVPGIFEALSAHAESDPDREARSYACQALGEIADPRAMAVFDKLLVPETDPYVYDDCLEGLIAMWAHYENAHEPAYDRTLEIVTQGAHPKEGRLAALWKLGDVPSLIADRADEWKPKKFVQVKEIEKALVTLASNDQEHPYAREDAVAALVTLGARKKVFQKIRKTVPKKPQADTPLAYLAEKLDEAIKGEPAD